MLLTDKVAMMAEILKVRPLTETEHAELLTYRQDLIEISLIAQQALDWSWLHEICAQLEIIDSILNGGSAE